MLLLASCSSKSGLEDMALGFLPDKVEESMSIYLGSVKRPEIIDVRLVYDSDSICVIQCVASSADASGNNMSQPMRYVFARDSFMSMAKGSDVYVHAAVGAKYLDDDGIKEFRQKMDDKSRNLYVTYLSMCDPIKQ